MRYSALSVAKAFLDLAEREGIALSNMKLQKLVFFAHGVALAGLNCPLIADDIKAWQFGPVIPRLYNRLKHYGSGNVTEITPREGEELQDIEGEMFRPIQAVWNVYKNKTATELSLLSHKEGSPWDTVWNKQKEEFQVIPDEIIKEYYLNIVKKKAA